jgi:hypothetical protein
MVVIRELVIYFPCKFRPSVCLPNISTMEMSLKYFSGNMRTIKTGDCLTSLPFGESEIDTVDAVQYDKILKTTSNVLKHFPQYLRFIIDINKSQNEEKERKMPDIDEICWANCQYHFSHCFTDL